MLGHFARCLHFNKYRCLVIYIQNMLLFETFFIHSAILVLCRVSLLGTWKKKKRGCNESSLDTMLFTSTKGLTLF